MVDILLKWNLPKWQWGLISLAGVASIGYLDLITDYELSLYVFYFLPIFVGAWFIGQSATITLSIISTIVWFWVDFQSGHTFSTYFYAVWDAVFRLVAFCIIGLSLSSIRQLLERERNLKEDLQRTISEVKLLESFLSICCQCKKIRNSDGTWQQIDTYICEHTDTKLSHGYCPECASKVMKNLRTEG